MRHLRLACLVIAGLAAAPVASAQDEPAPPPEPVPTEPGVGAGGQDLADGFRLRREAAEAFQAGDAVRARDRAREAVEALQKVEGLDPDVLHQARYFYAITLKRVGLGSGKAADFDWDPLWRAQETLKELVQTMSFATDAEAWVTLAHLSAEMAPYNGSYIQVLSGEAVAACEQAVGLYPDHRRAWLILGRVTSTQMFQCFNPNRAVEAFARDLEITPDREESAARLAEVWLFTFQQVDRAAEVVANGLKHRPKSSWLLKLQGFVHEKRGDLGKAAEAFHDAAAADLDNVDAVDLWVRAAIGGGVPPEEMLTKLDEFKAEHPASWKVVEVKAAIQIEMRRYPDALDTIRALENEMPDHPRREPWIVIRAEIYRLQGATEALIDAVMEALDRNPRSMGTQKLTTPDGEPLLNYWKRLNEWGKVRELAERLLARLASETEEDAQWKAAIANAVAEACANLGDHPAAEAAYKQAQELDPRNPQHFNAYGLMVRYLGRTDEAVAAWRRSLDLEIHHPWPRENLIVTELALGKVDAAREDLAAALEWRRQREDELSGDPEAGDALTEARFETHKARRLAIEAWRLGARK